MDGRLSARQRHHLIRAIGHALGFDVDARASLGLVGFDQTAARADQSTHAALVHQQRQRIGTRRRRRRRAERICVFGDGRHGAPPRRHHLVVQYIEHDSRGRPDRLRSAAQLQHALGRSRTRVVAQDRGLRPRRAAHPADVGAALPDQRAAVGRFDEEANFKRARETDATAATAAVDAAAMDADAASVESRVVVRVEVLRRQCCHGRCSFLRDALLLPRLAALRRLGDSRRQRRTTAAAAAAVCCACAVCRCLECGCLSRLPLLLLLLHV